MSDLYRDVTFKRFSLSNFLEAGEQHLIYVYISGQQLIVPISKVI